MSDSELYRFTQEEWAGRPWMIELHDPRGGHADGRRFTVRELPEMWRVPEPVGFMSYAAPELDLSRQPEMRTIDYRRTGRVTDDGAHIYERQR